MSQDLTARKEWQGRAYHVVLLLVLGAFGGTVAWYLRMPLPFMLGGVLSTICAVVVANSFGQVLYFPRPLRIVFIGMIGTMIGSTVSPSVLSLIPALSVSLACVALYVVLAHTLGYMICRKVGGFDRVTAFYASMPGGLIEAVILGERGGGDVRILTLSHFLRVLFVVIAVPAFFFLVSGDIVGSADGQSFERGPSDWIGLLTITAITFVGLIAGKILHLPAAHLLGPLLVSAILFGTESVEVSSPTWLLYLSQLIVGIGLGTQLSGATRVLLTRVLLSSCLQVVALLSLTFLFAWSLHAITGVDFNSLVLSFSPGGVTEMGLIALSLSLSPIVVTVHHVLRIFLTIFVAAISTRFLMPLKK